MELATSGLATLERSTKETGIICGADTKFQTENWSDQMIFIDKLLNVKLLPIQPLDDALEAVKHLIFLSADHKFLQVKLPETPMRIFLIDAA